MAMASPAQWARARGAVVVDGASYADASALSGIPESTIQKRAAEEGWQADRAAGLAYSVRVRQLKSTLLARAEQALEAGEVKVLSAYMTQWKTAEAAHPELRQAAEVPRGVRLEIALGVLRLIVDYLGKEDRSALAKLEPHLQGIGEAIEARFGR